MTTTPTGAHETDQPSDRPGNRTMRAVTQGTYGPPEVLELRRVAVPEPADDQVLVRVKAASLNVFDWHMTTGTPYLVRMVAGFARPKSPIPGADIAGVVEEVGSEVTRFAPGDEVFSDIGHGTFAEFAVASERAFAHKPAGVTFEQAAATPLAGITALQGLRDHGGVTAGQRVLVNGASGGVGTFAVQIAKALGATVTAVVSSGKVEMAKSIGADRVIDYTTDDFTETERGYDVLFDNAGTRPWSATSKVLVAGGVNVTITGPKHRWMGPFRALLFRKAASKLGDKRMTWFTAHVTIDDLDVLAGLLESGAVKPVIEKTFRLEDTAAALRYLGEGHALGKLVIRP